MNEQQHGKGGPFQTIVPAWISGSLILMVLFAVIVAIPMQPGGSREPARKSTCQSNLKECAIALQIYWNDYDAHLPSSALVSGSPTWNQADFETFAAGPGRSVQGHPRVIWSRLLSKHMRNKEIVFCPSDGSDHSSPNSRTSYWWKLAIDKAWYGEQCTKPCQTEADFAYNADQIVLYERCGFHSGGQDGLRNNVQVLAAYLDSHIKAINITNSLPAKGNRRTTSPSALGEPAYFNYDNKTNTRIKDPNTLANHVDPARFSDKL